MKLLFTALIFFSLFNIAKARWVEGALSYQELLDKADLVVIARPVATKDTSERRVLPGMEYIHNRFVGVETKLEVSAIFKGKKSIKSVVLHHYRQRPGNGTTLIINRLYSR